MQLKVMHLPNCKTHVFDCWKLTYGGKQLHAWVCLLQPEDSGKEHCRLFDSMSHQFCPATVIYKKINAIIAITFYIMLPVRILILIHVHSISTLSLKKKGETHVISILWGLPCLSASLIRWPSRLNSGCQQVWENFGNEKKIDFFRSLSKSKSTKTMKNDAWLFCLSSIYHTVHLTGLEHFPMFPISFSLWTGPSEILTLWVKYIIQIFRFPYLLWNHI